MNHKGFILTMAALLTILGFVAGLLIQAAVISAADPQPQVLQVLWEQPCDGRVVVLRSMLVRCVTNNEVLDPTLTPTYRPTPSPSPTEGT